MNHRTGLQVAVEQDLTVLVQDAEIHGADMEIDATVRLVLFGVESHGVSSFLVTFPTSSIPPGYAEEGASISINRAADALQRPLRSRFQARLSASVDMTSDGKG